MPLPETLVQKFWSNASTYPHAPSLLIRNRDTEPYHHVSGAAGFSYTYTPPTFLTVPAGQVALAVSTVTAYLRREGFAPGDRAAIMAWNCPEWIIADLAIQSLGGITVPIYPHSTPEQVNYVIEDAGAKFLFSNEQEQLHKLAQDSSCAAVYFDDIPAHLTGQQAPPPDRPFMEWYLPEQLSDAHSRILWHHAGYEHDALAESVNKITASDAATIIYTSGSTGVPKGVVLTHEAFAEACKGMVAHGFDLSAGRDVYLSYLPLAHVYERACGAYLCLWTGVPMAFCKVDEVGEMLKQVRPTLLHGVPAVWRKVKDKIQGNLAAATGLKSKLIAWAFQESHGAVGQKLADALVFNKIRNELGGRLRFTSSGGAPISAEILKFYQSIGIELLQGYGLTETTGASTVNSPHGNKVGSVGTVMGNLQVRIVPLPGQEDSGEGEIQFRGPTVMKEYWNKPEETAKTFTEDGWFKTGDRGRIDDDGFLFITGRIKRLLKTDGGKYVAPEKIEKAFEGDPIVQYIVPVGDGKPYISGLVFINIELAKELLAKAGVTVAANEDAPAFYATHPLIAEAVSKAIEHANAKLERWEQLKKTRTLPDEATIQAGLLTPTLKIRTEEVLKRYADVISGLYS